MGSERTAGKAWTKSAEAPPAGSWIEVLRTQGREVFSRSGLRALLTVVAVVLLSSVAAGVGLTLVLTLMLGTYTGLPVDATAFLSRPEVAVQILLVLAGMLLGGGLDADFQGAQIARDTAFSQVHMTGLVMSYLLVLWWCLRGVYRRSCRSETGRWSGPAILTRAFWEALFAVIVVVPALGFWSPSLALPLTLEVTLQTRWWSLALIVFLLVFLAALTGRLQWLRAPDKGLIELAVDEARHLAVTLLVGFAVAATVATAVALASAPPQAGMQNAAALTLADPVYLGFITATTVLGGGIVTWTTVTSPFNALIATPAPFTGGFGPETSAVGAPLLLGLWLLTLVLTLRPAVVLGLRRRAADEALAARDLAEGRPSGAVEGQARSWEAIRSRRRKAGRAVALPVLVTAVLVIVQQTFVNSISWYEPVLSPPADGPAPGYSWGAFLPWYFPVFAGLFTALVSACAAVLPSLLERRAPRLLDLLAWRTRELAVWRTTHRADDGHQDSGRGMSTAVRSTDRTAVTTVEIRELEYEGSAWDDPARGRE